MANKKALVQVSAYWVNCPHCHAEIENDNGSLLHDSSDSERLVCPDCGKVFDLPVALLRLLERPLAMVDHYLVIGKEHGQPVGCCDDEDRDDYPRPTGGQPDVEFVQVSRDQCPVCEEWR